MKKTIFSLLILVMMVVFFSTADAAIYRSAKDGKKDGGGTGVTGYRYVQTYYWELWIWCWDPGASPCPAGIIDPDPPNPPTPADQIAAVNYALSQIANNVLTGIELQGNINIEWTATDVDATTSDIIVWYTNEIKPLKPN